MHAMVAVRNSMDRNGPILHTWQMNGFAFLKVTENGVSMAWCKRERGPGRQLGPVGVVVGGAVAFAALVMASPAMAEATSAVAYPAEAAMTRYSGPGFDTCTAPSLAAIVAWGRSPYRAIGVYIGGVNRGCSQPQLTARWVTEVSERKWWLLPLYVGLQPPCVVNGRSRPARTEAVRPADQTIVPSEAASQGRAAADDAAAEAGALGMGYGSAVYDDIEDYPTADTACRAAVLRFVSGWTRELHRLGYLAGVYANLSSGAPDLSSVYTSRSYARPDALWIARWDRNASLASWAGVRGSRWAVHRRVKQYRGGHNETYGGVTIKIDSDVVDAPVATVAHGYRVTSASPLNARAGPSTSHAIVRTYVPGSATQVVCQAPGSAVASTSVWDKLADGTYVTDYYLSTPSKTGYSAPLARCDTPTR